MFGDRSPVLVSTARTAVGKFGGALGHLSALQLGAAAVQSALAPFQGAVVPDHTFLGNVVQAGSGQNPGRVAAIRGGVPTTVPGTTINDVCLASMTATGLAASMIRAGEIDCAVVGGFESMSQAMHGVRQRSAPKVGDGETVDLLIRDGLWCAVGESGMGEISDRANRELSISRADQDEFSVESHRRADRATSSGRFADEITALADVLKSDEGIRPASTLAALTRLTASFTKDGTITAGNASQMSDAGAAGVLMSRDRAQSLGITPLVEIVDRATVAGPDVSLHLKPANAARQLLERNGMSTTDIGIWEINEAFAGVVLASARNLGIDLDHVNPNGGAVALGHPLGASGFRMIMSLSLHMRRQNAEYGIASICGGGGQGQAILLKAAWQ